MRKVTCHASSTRLFRQCSNKLRDRMVYVRYGNSRCHRSFDISTVTVSLEKNSTYLGHLLEIFVKVFALHSCVGKLAQTYRNRDTQGISDLFFSKSSVTQCSARCSKIESQNMYFDRVSELERFGKRVTQKKKKEKKERERREKRGPRYYRQVNEPGAL